ncbi:MAG: glutathione synthase [Planctomycetota bacterium]
MSTRKAAMAFVMDPIEKVDIAADTTFALMLEAQRRGHQVCYVDPRDLGIDTGRVTAKVHAVTLRREAGRHVDVAPGRQVLLDAEFDLVFQREDPPVDADYVTATQMLSLCRRARVLNRPEGILAANEKLYALNFPDLLPETCVAREIPKLLDFMAKMGGEMIVKPLHGKGGEGIFHVRRDDRNLFSILEQSTGFGTRWTMAQRYIPAVREGDKRILLVGGEPLGAVLRVPAEDETRSNLHVGGRPAKAVIDEHDCRIIERIAPRLREDGLFFVGIDVIGNLLTEVNVTSPTGLQEMNVLDGVRYEETVLDRVEALLEESPEAGG